MAKKLKNCTVLGTNMFLVTSVKGLHKAIVLRGLKPIDDLLGIHVWPDDYPAIVSFENTLGVSAKDSTGILTNWVSVKDVQEVLKLL